MALSPRVPGANVEAFETTLRELKQVASKQPGMVACDVPGGAVRGGEREYFIVYRFEHTDALRKVRAVYCGSERLHRSLKVRSPILRNAYRRRPRVEIQSFVTVNFTTRDHRRYLRNGLGRSEGATES